MAKKNYVNNKDFLQSLTEYRARVKAWDGEGEPPRIPDYVGECIYLICTRMSRRQNFCGYTYIEDMRGDGIENSIRAVKNFDPAKSNNPFGYFSRIAWRAFIRRIDTEKEQTYVKIKNFENLHVLDEAGEFQKFSGNGGRADGYAPSSRPGNEHTDAFVRDFEGRNERRVARRAKTKRKSPEKSKLSLSRVASNIGKY